VPLAATTEFLQEQAVELRHTLLEQLPPLILHEPLNSPHTGTSSIERA
jgi:hypothetical protein